MLIDIVTIFPRMFSPVLGESILKRAQVKGLVKIKLNDLRDFAYGPYKKVDDTVCGGGGMLFKPEPLFEAVESIIGSKVYPDKKKNKNKRIILFSPKGKRLDQKLVNKFLKYEHLILLAPRYEGVDQRVVEHFVDEEISIGGYVLTGGEIPAMVFVDCLVRLIPGVVSDKESIKNESFQKPSLDYPHYTKPVDFRGLKVPKILLSGDHKKIAYWRKVQAMELTKKRRPDLLNKDKG